MGYWNAIVEVFFVILFQCFYSRHSVDGETEGTGPRAAWSLSSGRGPNTRPTELYNSEEFFILRLPCVYRQTGHVTITSISWSKL